MAAGRPVLGHHPTRSISRRENCSLVELAHLVAETGANYDISGAMWYLNVMVYTLVHVNTNFKNLQSYVHDLLHLPITITFI